MEKKPFYKKPITYILGGIGCLGIIILFIVFAFVAFIFTPGSESEEIANGDAAEEEVVEEKEEKEEQDELEEKEETQEEFNAVEWVKSKSKAVMDVKQHDDRVYIDIDGEAGFSISSSIKGAYNEFNWLEDIFKDEDINRVTFQYMYSFVGGEKDLGYSFAYDRDAYEGNREVVYESGDVEPYLVFDNALEYDFHPDVWEEAPKDLKQGLNNEPTKIESY